MSDLTVADVLERAAHKLKQPGAWTQGAFSRNAYGIADRDVDETAANDPVCWCALGALAEASNVDPMETYAFSMSAPKVFGYLFLREFVGGDVAKWNDDPNRTQAEVVATLREAAALAREQGL